MRKLLLTAAALVLVTTACRAEANFLVDVAEDGSGDITVEFGLDEELLELVEGFGGGTEELFGAVPEGQDVETRTDGDMTYFATTESFADPQGLIETTGILEDSGAAFTQLDLVVADGAATLDAVIETPNATEAIEGLGGSGLGGFEIADDFFTSALIVSLPGELDESNADEVLADGRLKWDVPLLGGTVTVHAVTSSGGGELPWGLILGVLGAIVVIGGALWLTRRNKKSSVAAVESTAAPDAAAPVFEAPNTSGDAGGETTEV